MSDRFHCQALDSSEAATARALHALLEQADREEAERLGLSGATPLRRGVHELQGSGECWIGGFVADELVGAVSLHADAEDEGLSGIGALVVHPAHRRQGLGTRLLHAARVNAGLTAPLSALTTQGNEAGLALLRQAGFRELRRWALRHDGLRLPLVKLLHPGG